MLLITLLISITQNLPQENNPEEYLSLGVDL